MIFQKYNKRLGRWVKYKKMANGRVIILNQKQQNPQTKFKGVIIK